MMSTFKSELRKLLTVRSTYIWGGVALLFIAFMTFYVEGMRGNVETLSDPGHLGRMLLNVPPVAAQLGLIAAAMLVIHEYRYNTITYTLTSSSSRTQVLLAKMVVVFMYALIMVLVAIGVGTAGFYAGGAVAGKTIVAQQLDLGYLLGHSLFYGVGYMLLGFFVSVLFRNMIFTLVFMFMAPSTIEPLLSLLLKEKAIYLPFAALNAQIMPPGSSALFGGGTTLSAGKAALVFSAYLLLTSTLAWWLFLKRDAN